MTRQMRFVRVQPGTWNGRGSEFFRLMPTWEEAGKVVNFAYSLHLGEVVDAPNAGAAEKLRTELVEWAESITKAQALPVLEYAELVDGHLARQNAHASIADGIGYT